MNNKSEKFWVVIPAAGVGKRMGADVPKQYLQLAGKAVLLHTLERLGNCAGISGVYLGVSQSDPYWGDLEFTAEWLKSVCDGGQERADTVLRILDDMQGTVQAEDWVLVHDAVRPCVRCEDIMTLMKTASEHDGGLLGRPITDTVKLAGRDGRIVETISREGLWRAQTPQMFRYRELREALVSARHGGLAVTDEASAMELAGFRPLMVKGRSDNIKITIPGDLELAGLFLKNQELL